VAVTIANTVPLGWLNVTLSRIKNLSYSSPVSDARFGVCAPCFHSGRGLTL